MALLLCLRQQMKLLQLPWKALDVTAEELLVCDDLADILRLLQAEPVKPNWQRHRMVWSFYCVFASTDEALTTASEVPGVTAEEPLVCEDLAGTAEYHVIPAA